MKTKNWVNLLLLFLVCGGGPLQAEIEEIIITWNALLCQDYCTPLIDKNFGSIAGVKNLQINAPSGRATMGWDSRYPFSYEPFRYAAGSVGIRIKSMRVRVKGRVSYHNDNIDLISNEDNTHFLLIGPIQTEPGRYNPSYNFANRPLPLETRDKLLEAEKNRSTIVISGPLYLPSRYAPTLVVEQMRLNAK